ERLVEAAGRIEALAAWAKPVSGHVSSGVGSGAARRAIAATGDVTLEADDVIVELRPRANIAAGEHEHSLAHSRVVREHEPVPDARAYVVRDAHRHAWMRDAADREGAVVIEVGLPVWRPVRARGYLATYGAGRASLAAADEVLHARVTA